MGCGDKFIWPHSRTGEYNIKFGYHVARREAITTNNTTTTSRITPEKIWKITWSSDLPQKIKVFVWKLCNNALAVQDNLHIQNVSRSGHCQICLSAAETIDHAMLLCPWTRPVWFGSPTQRIIILEGITTIDNWLLMRHQELSRKPTTLDEKWTTLCLTLWAI